jgi:hypothetical protein
MEMQSTIDKLNSIVSKIASGSASQAELESFVALSAELHELAIVLRYKAYEAMVYEKSGSTTVTIEESIQPETQTEAPLEAVAEEEPADQSGFDLFSLDEEEPVQQEELVEFSSESIEQEVETEVVLENEVPIVQVSTEIKVEEALTDLHPIFAKVKQSNSNLTSRLMMSHLDTLNGAFSFNERLQIIQELFKGSGDDFTDFIDAIEETQNHDTAKQLINQLAFRNQWDEENHVAVEFVQKIERKYV